MSRAGGRSLGVSTGAALVIGNMVGAGVFTTSGFALADLGSREAVLLAWLIGALIAGCGAKSYLALTERIRGDGGEYLFLSRALHPMAGFLAGWISLIAGFTAPIAVAAHGLDAYWGPLASTVNSSLPPGSIGLAAILVCGFAHAATHAVGSSLQNVAVGIQVAAILGVLAFAAASGEMEAPRLDPSGLAHLDLPVFAKTLVWISFSYSGWNAAVYLASAFDDSPLRLRRATWVGLTLVAMLYLALNVVFLYSAPIDQLSGRADIGAVAAAALGGDALRKVLSVVIGLGLLTSISAMLMVGPRVYVQMARDFFPDSFAERDAPEWVLRGAMSFQVVLSSLAYGLADLRGLLVYVGFLLGISATASVACLFWGSVRGPRKLIVPPSKSAFCFVVATLGGTLLVLLDDPGQLKAGIATVFVGVLLFGLLRGIQARLSAPFSTPLSAEAGASLGSRVKQDLTQNAKPLVDLVRADHERGREAKDVAAC